MELHTYWLAVRAGWKIVVVATLVALAAAVALSRPTTSTYVSTTRMFVASQTGSPSLNEFYQRNAIASFRVASYVVLATSGLVADEVSKTVGVPVSPSAVTATVIEGTLIMEISVTDTDPERARQIAAGFGEVLPLAIADVEQTEGTEGAGVQVEVIDEANLSSSPVPTTPILRNYLAALLLGLGVGIGGAVLRYVFVQQKSNLKPGVGAA